MADSDTSFENSDISPTCDALVDGIIGMLKPCIDQLDQKVRSTRASQSALHDELESLTSELNSIQEEIDCPLPLNSYIKKLQNAKRRVVVINNLLQNTQERLNKLHKDVSAETNRRKALLESDISAST